METMNLRSCRLAVFIFIGFVLPSAHCERLPIRSYNAADGLPSNDVHSISKDSRGFLWFGTNEGLSQFDGYEFRTYGRANGLPRDSISSFVQTREGSYWAATFDGIAEFEPDAHGSNKFRVYRPLSTDGHRVYVLYEDHMGQLLCGTEGGLFRLRKSQAPGEKWQFEAVPLLSGSGKSPVDRRVISLFEDSYGDLWIGTFHALYRRTRDGRSFEYRRKPPLGLDFLWNVVFEDRKGRLWVGTGFGLWRLRPDGADEFKVEPVFVPKRRLVVSSILEDADGSLWLGTSSGLAKWNPDQGHTTRPRFFAESNGLTDRDITTLCSDREGNLWVGSSGGGAMRVAKNGFITYVPAEIAGFDRFDNAAPTLFQDHVGDVHVAFHHVMSFMRKNKFVEVVPAIPKQRGSYLGWGWHQTILQDRSREWWIPTAEGLVRFPDVPVESLDRTLPKAVYTTRDGLRTNDIFRVFEDRGGNIWVACIGPAGVNGLSRWDRRTQRFEHFSENTSTVATAFAEDRDGAIWIGYYTGGLARFRDGTFKWFSAQDGLTGGGIQALHVDHQGRLWIASTRGLVRLDVPSEAHPKFNLFGITEGLSSNVVLCVSEDSSGRIYLATGRGIDRIQANGRIAPGQVKHLTQADGLTSGTLRDVLVDRNGVVWCASTHGVSRFLPEVQGSEAPPPVFLRELRIRGTPYQFWDLGATKVSKIVLKPHQNQLQISFAGLAFAPGEGLGYQYKLEPVNGDWSETSGDRSVIYSNIAPGEYRFSVRLVTEHQASGDPSVLEFSVLAPIWERWWFQLLVAAFILGTMYWLHRYRTLRVLELERVRTRIATDLHDDIGSGLSQIAILSEVARTRVHGDTTDTTAMLSSIGSLSRELTESMSDIVWSVNPRRDYLADLAQRMRRFSSDVLDGGNINLQFHFCTPQKPIRIDSNVRREVYLIFKESVTNVARHSHCTRVEIAVVIDDHHLNLTVRDNGRGLGEASCHTGNGLRSIRERAERIGARLEVYSGQPSGVCVSVNVPLDR
jgi:ligand-binding sensor domain-containing protein/two-component sensor histidine kinase